MSQNWVEAIEQGESILSLAERFSLPERDIVLGVANTLWDWGEADKAIPILERHLARDCDHYLQMAYLRCLISLGREDKSKIQDAVSNLHSSFKRREGNQSVYKHSSDVQQKDRPLRLGFICTYSNLKPVEFSIVPMLRALDHVNFRSYFFSLNQEGMPLLDEVCDEHVVLMNMDVHDICNVIREKKIDILFDLNGILREDFPFEVFAMHPSPIQAGWWNTPLSSGLETVKYYFMDRSILTPDYDDMFKEKIIDIPGGATLCYQLPDKYPLTPPLLQGKGSLLSPRLPRCSKSMITFFIHGRKS